MWLDREMPFSLDEKEFILKERNKRNTWEDIAKAGKKSNRKFKIYKDKNNK